MYNPPAGMVRGDNKIQAYTIKTIYINSNYLMLLDKMAEDKVKKKAVKGMFDDIFETDVKEEVSEGIKPAEGLEDDMVEKAEEIGGIPSEGELRREITGSASDVSKDISAKKESATTKTTTEKKEREDAMSVVDILKEAHEKGSISKEKYDDAIKNLVRKKVELTPGKGEHIIAQMEFVERDGKPEIVLEEGEIDIPHGSSVEMIKRNGEISIIVEKKGRRREIPVGGGVVDIEKLIEKGGVRRMEIDSKEMEDILRGVEGFGKGDMWFGKEEEGLMDDRGEGIDLIDLRKEFREKEEEEDEEEEDEEEEESVGIIDRIRDMIRKTTKESKTERLRRLALENLESTKSVRDERRSIVAVAYVLKGFLEVAFDIPGELTYIELIQDLGGRNIDNKLKNSLIRFFKTTYVMIYADAGGMVDYHQAYNLAKKTVDELT